MPRRLWTTSALLLVVALLFSACAAPAAAPPAAATATEAAGAETAAAAATECATKDPVTLQLKWVAQAQFAGYYAAQAEGFYDDECLDITINPGGPDIVPEQVVAGGQADFGINFVPSLLSAREQGTNLVNIAQVFERSAMREISWKDTGIAGPADLKGKKVAVWFGGNEFELLATLAKYAIDKDKDVQLIQQPFDMNLLLERQVDAAAAMTYNELAQVLETPDKDGNLYTMDQLNIIDFNQEGTAMLQDGIFATRGVPCRRQKPGHCRALPARLVQGLDVLPRQRRQVCRLRARTRSRPAARPPDLDDERDQPADLALHGRHRPDGPRPV